MNDEEPFEVSESIRKRPIYRNDFSGRSYTPGDYGEIAPYPCQKESLWEKIVDWIEFFGVLIGYLADAVCEWLKERL
jgi:hypothetical protein